MLSCTNKIKKSLDEFHETRLVFKKGADMPDDLASDPEAMSYLADIQPLAAGPKAKIGSLRAGVRHRVHQVTSLPGKALGKATNLLKAPFRLLGRAKNRILKPRSSKSPR